MRIVFKVIHLIFTHKGLFHLFVVTIFPILLTLHLWQEVWAGVRPFAWDGSGQYTLAQIYSQNVFPDTFGWTNAFYGGMPHPNNYPPLFYWLVALLDHSGLFSFPTAFKILIVLPTLLLPAATWYLAWKISNKNNLVAFCGGLSITPLLVDYRFFVSSGPLGITYLSTFLTGLYTHPLGYLFLILWYAVYSNRHQPLWRVCLAELLLICALLSSFFSASVAMLLIGFTIISDLLNLRHSVHSENTRQRFQPLIAHLASPFIAFCLALFWLAPVIATSDYLITQPSRVPIKDLVPAAMWGWYAIAAAGALISLGIREQRSKPMLVYLAACLVLAVLIFTAGTFAPGWFPIHPSRLIATFNFLLAVPVGIFFAFIFGWLTKILGVASLFDRLNNESLTQSVTESKEKPKAKSKVQQPPTASLKGWQTISLVFAVIIGGVFLWTMIKPADFGKLVYYPTADRETIDPILQFAKDHKAGRYLVETPPFNDLQAGHEARAINNYLPAEGNETVSLFFREASPSAIFFVPIVDRFSVQADPAIISSTLTDDKDFVNQSPALHLQQARMIGVRYLVIRSPWARRFLDAEKGIKYRRDFGLWSVYELDGEPVQPVRSLLYKPALVVTDLNLKGRRHNALDFVRFAEEQIASNWYDVLLARLPETKLDRLQIDNGFGALIVESYDYDDEEIAYNKLREFAANRTLILLENENSLFRRIQESQAEFPQIKIINRTKEELGEWLTPGAPSRNYSQSQIRGIYKQIQQTLNERKIPVNEAAAQAITGERAKPNMININLSSGFDEAAPVLIDTTFHPNWQRADGKDVYPVTPFFMLTFAREPVSLKFMRRSSDWVGVIISAVTLLSLCVALGWCYGNHLIKGIGKFDRRRKTSVQPPVQPVLEEPEGTNV